MVQAEHGIPGIGIDATGKCRIHTGQTAVCDHKVVTTWEMFGTQHHDRDTENTQKHAYSSMTSNAGEVAWPKLNQMNAESLPGTHSAVCTTSPV